MKYFVYVLQSLKDANLYIGITNDLKRRLYEHNLGYKNSTRHRVPFKIVYFEEHENRIAARKREKYLKSGCGREFVKNQIKYSGVAQR